MKMQLSIEGMKCEGCVETVLKCLQSIDGVTDALINLEDKSAIIESQYVISDHAIHESLAKEKYKVVKIIELYPSNNSI